MSGIIHLKQSIKNIWVKTVMLAFGLFAFEMLFSILGTSTDIQKGVLKDLKDMPRIMEQMMGQGFAETLLKYGVIAFGYIHPFMLVLFVLFIFFGVSQVIISEISSGTIGFTYSKPISRKRIFFNLVVIIYGGLGIMAFSAFLASFTGILLFHGNRLSTSPFASLAWNLYLIMILCAGYVVLISVFANTGKSLYTYGGITLMVFYLLSMATSLWKPLAYLSPVNPFSYYEPFRMLMGGRIETATSIFIIGSSMVMFIIAGWLFSKRDIAGG